MLKQLCSTLETNRLHVHYTSIKNKYIFKMLTVLDKMIRFFKDHHEDFSPKIWFHDAALQPSPHPLH